MELIRDKDRALKKAKKNKKGGRLGLSKSAKELMSR